MTVAAPTHCHCRCHSAEAPLVASFWGVDVRDPIEAAASCTKCRDKHSPAITAEYKPPTTWSAEEDAHDPDSTGG